MANYLHTMLRVTDPERSRTFYEALGMEFRRESEIVRDGNEQTARALDEHEVGTVAESAVGVEQG